MGCGQSFGVNAARSEEEQTIGPGAVARVNDVGLDREIFPDKLRRIGIVRADSPNFGRRQKNMPRTFPVEETLDRCPICQIQLGVRAHEQVAIAGPLQHALDCGANESPMACDVNAFALLHWGAPVRTRDGCRR